MSIYFTSDLHFGHRHVLEACRPQFETTDEMDAFLLENWNHTVTDNDEVYILGDLCYKSKNPADYYLSRMSGKKHLIVGNHDYKWLKAMEDEDKKQYFVSVDHLCTVNMGKHLLTLCHYPMLEWNRSRYASDQATSTSWLIHGHIHNSTTLESFRYIKEHLPCALNAGVDINSYMPVTFEQMLENNNRWYGRITF